MKKFLTYISIFSLIFIGGCAAKSDQSASQMQMKNSDQLMVKGAWARPVMAGAKFQLLT